MYYIFVDLIDCSNIVNILSEYRKRVSLHTNRLKSTFIFKFNTNDTMVYKIVLKNIKKKKNLKLNRKVAKQIITKCRIPCIYRGAFYISLI